MTEYVFSSMSFMDMHIKTTGKKLKLSFPQLKIKQSSNVYLIRLRLVAGKSAEIEACQSWTISLFNFRSKFVPLSLCGLNTGIILFS